MTDFNNSDGPNDENQNTTDLARRHFLKKLGMVGVTGAAAVTGVSKATSTPAWGGSSFMDTMGDFFQDHYVRMSDEEMKDALERIQRKAKRKFGVDISCEDTKPLPGT